MGVCSLKILKKHKDGYHRFHLGVFAGKPVDFSENETHVLLPVL